MMPDLGALMNFSSVVDPQTFSAAEVEPTAAERIARLNALTDSYGARLVLVMPVMLDTKNGTAWLGILNAAARKRVTALMPAPSGSFARDLYRDAGFHLNPTGAAAFTDILIPELQKALSSVIGAN
jgi:lysophospholipase L1-like esterase